MVSTSIQGASTDTWVGGTPPFSHVETHTPQVVDTFGEAYSAGSLKGVPSARRAVRSQPGSGGSAEVTEGEAWHLPEGQSSLTWRCPVVRSFSEYAKSGKGKIVPDCIDEVIESLLRFLPLLWPLLRRDLILKGVLAKNGKSVVHFIGRSRGIF